MVSLCFGFKEMVTKWSSWVKMIIMMVEYCTCCKVDVQALICANFGNFERVVTNPSPQKRLLNRSKKAKFDETLK
jgi:hypothetical protein